MITNALLEHGAAKVYAICSHGILSGSAVEDIAKSEITKVVMTNSVVLSDAIRASPKIQVLGKTERERERERECVCVGALDFFSFIPFFRFF
jgi:ribose-phosphate pyrophosphokinase